MQAPSQASPYDHHEINHSSFSNEATAAISKFKEHIAESHHDPRIDQENIDSIEQDYFTYDETFDPGEYELKVALLQISLYC